LLIAFLAYVAMIHSGGRTRRSWEHYSIWLSGGVVLFSSPKMPESIARKIFDPGGCAGGLAALALTVELALVGRFLSVEGRAGESQQYTAALAI